MAAQLDLKGFIGGHIGLAAFTGSNIERLLTTALARRSLYENAGFLSHKLQCKKNDKTNLSALEAFFDRNGETGEEILNFQPLEGYIKESARILRTTVTDASTIAYYTGIINSTPDNLLQYLRNKSPTVDARNDILYQVIELYLAGKRHTLGDLTGAFEIQENKWPKGLKKLEDFISDESKTEHNIDDDELAELEPYIRACREIYQELETEEIDQLVPLIKREKDLHSKVHSHILKLCARGEKLKEMYNQRLDEIVDRFLRILFEDLCKKKPITKVPKAISQQTVDATHFHSAAGELMTNSIIDKIPSVQNYYKLIFERTASLSPESSLPSSSESSLSPTPPPLNAELLNLIRDVSLSDSHIKAKYELLDSVMNKLVPGTVHNFDWMTLREEYMNIAPLISKLGANRNTRVHYKPESQRKEALEMKHVKDLYEKLINSRFFELAHHPLTGDALDQKKKMYVTHTDTVSVSAILEACKQKLGSFTYQDKNLYAEDYKNLLDVQGQCEQILGELSTDIDKNQDLVIALLAKHYAKNIENIQDAKDRSEMAPHELRNLRERMRTTLRVGNFQNTSDPSSLKSMLYNFKHGNTIRRKLGNQYRDHLSQSKQWEVTIDYPSLQTIPDCPELGGTPDARVTMTRKGEAKVFIAIFRRTKLAEVPRNEIKKTQKKVSWLLRAFPLADLGHFVTFRGNSVRIDEIRRIDIDNTELESLLRFYFGAMLPELALPMSPQLRNEFLPFWKDVKNACRSIVGIVEE